MKCFGKWGILAGSVAGLVMGGGIPGCVIHTQSEPAVVYEEPVNADVVVDTPPPDDQVEVIGEAPGPDFVWIGGFYVFDHGHYAWRGGHWEHRPRPGAEYERGHWERGDRGYHYQAGHWR